MKKREGVQIFSLSFLDLICCATAGIIVLYVTAPKPNREKPDAQPSIARVELKCKNEAAPVEFVVRLVNGSAVEGFSAVSAGEWTFPERGVAEMLIEEPLADSGLAVEVWVVDLDYANWDACKHKEIGVALTLLEMPGNDLSQQPKTITIGGQNHVRFDIR